jgi:hypothetical protein
MGSVVFAWRVYDSTDPVVAPNNPCANGTLAATGVNPQQNVAQANKWTAVGALIGLSFGDPFQAHLQAMELW